MRYPFDSPEASELNIKIFETIYYASLTASCELAKDEGPYESYAGSPVSRGVSVGSVQCAKHTNIHVHVLGCTQSSFYSFYYSL